MGSQEETQLGHARLRQYRQPDKHLLRGHSAIRNNLALSSYTQGSAWKSAACPACYTRSLDWNMLALHTHTRRMQRVCPSRAERAVVQSSGKSSVLEAVVGKDFLPRGTDIVTKRPLVVTMKQIPQGEAEYGIFQHVTPKGKGARYNSFPEICEEIEAETIRFIAKLNQGRTSGPQIVVSKIPMFLEVRPRMPVLPSRSAHRPALEYDEAWPPPTAPMSPCARGWQHQLTPEVKMIAQTAV